MIRVLYAVLILTLFCWADHSDALPDAVPVYELPGSRSADVQSAANLFLQDYLVEAQPSFHSGVVLKNSITGTEQCVSMLNALLADSETCFQVGVDDFIVLRREETSLPTAAAYVLVFDDGGVSARWFVSISSDTPWLRNLAAGFIVYLKD